MSGTPTVTSGYNALGVGSVVTPGGPVTSKVYTQLAFDPRINKQVYLEGRSTVEIGGNGPYSSWSTESGLARGFVVQAQSQAQTDGSLFGCAFLFNPSIITLQHAIDSNSSLVLPQYRRLSADTGVYVIGLASTIDFSLFFDRTYEVNTAAELGNGTYAPYGPLGFLPGTSLNPESSGILTNDDPRLIGALADVNALYRVVGMTNPIPNQSWTNDNGSVTSNITVTGPMQQVPCYFMLSSNMVSNVPNFYGYIDSLGITYTHFTQAMVPMRAQVDVEITMLPATSS